MTNPKDRECGSCTACCVELKIKRCEFLNIDGLPDTNPTYLEKLAGTPCAFLSTNQGCSAYDCRPHVCRGFHCAWRQGLFSSNEVDRPDHSGVMWVRSGRNTGETHPALNASPVMHVHVTQAARSPELSAAAWIRIRRIGGIMPLILTYNGTPLGVVGAGAEALAQRVPGLNYLPFTETPPWSLI